MTSRGLPPPRIAIAFQGDATDPDSWSGVPAGLWRGLRGAGFEPVAIDARFPGYSQLAHRLRMSWAEATANPLFAQGAGFVAGRAATRADIAGAVTIGSGFALPARLRSVTFEDMTVAQAVRQPDSIYSQLGSAAVARWEGRQRRIYQRSRACCVTSGWAARSLREDYGVSGGKVHVVGLGRNVDVDPVRRDWSTPRFLFVGLDWERKRGAEVLDGLAFVRRHYPGATLDLVGGHPPIEAAGVTGHGRLPLGSPEGRRRYAELLARSTCFLMPSRFEPYGIAYLDAAGAGVASIGTTVGGASDAIGDCGRLVDPGDPRGLFEAMLELADPTTARQLGEKARARSCQLTWRKVSERVAKALDLAASGGG